MSTRARVEAMGLIGGLIVALVVLIGLSVWLLSPEATSAKVLVAVWLWALPVAGAFAALGWLAARVVLRLTGGGR